MSLKIAVVGATGNVGRETLMTLAERDFPASKVVALASESSLGTEVSYGEDDTIPVDALVHYDFAGTDIVFFCTGADISKSYAPKAAAAGATVIDFSSHFRLEPGVPLVVPEVNGHVLEKPLKKGIVANGNCVAIPLTMVLKPLHDIAKIKRVVLSTYQSVSGAGQKAMDELFNQTKSIFVNEDQEPQEFTKPIAFNVIPHIDNFERSGFTGEEVKIAMETKKILDPAINVTATCVRVPTFIGHAMSAHVEFESAISVDEARKSFGIEKGVLPLDNPEEDAYITPIDVAGEDMVIVSRIRQDTTVPHGLALWIAADNLRKGAALNGVQIAEALLKTQIKAPTHSGVATQQ